MLYECWTVDTDIFTGRSAVILRLRMVISEDQSYRQKCCLPIANSESVLWIDKFPHVWAALDFILYQRTHWIELGYTVDFEHDIDRVQGAEYPDNWFDDLSKDIDPFDCAGDPLSAFGLMGAEYLSETQDAYS